MSKRLVLTLALVVAASLVLAEVLLRPASGDRLHLLVILAIPAVVAVAATPMLSRWVSRRASVAGAVLAVALCSLTLGAATSSAASNAMFVSSHDFRLFVVVLLLSSGIALVVGSQLSRPLARDIQRLEHVAERVAAGDLTVRSGIDRHDEVGATARAVDAMVLTLADMERERAMLTEARRHLFTSIGHDLRTPLSAMRAAVESLEDGVAPDPQRYFGIISAQLTTVDTLLDQLIEFARLESGHASTVRERLSVAELADESAEALAPLAGRRGIRIMVDADGSGMVLGNAVELGRVLRNLVDNAIRHSPDDGTVHVAVEDRPTGVTTRVMDTGEGFPADFRAHAFEPFTRADPSRNARTGNTGLGLAICQAIVAVHQGRIWLGDGPGGDVRFTLPPLATPPSQTPPIQNEAP